MSITVEIAGRSLEIAPYMLGDLELAGDFIDEMNDRLAEAINIERENEGKAEEDKKRLRVKDMMKQLRCLVEILAVGTAKVDPEMTADAIMGLVDFTFMKSLQEAVLALLASSGLTPGEVKAPSRRAKGAQA